MGNTCGGFSINIKYRLSFTRSIHVETRSWRTSAHICSFTYTGISAWSKCSLLWACHTYAVHTTFLRFLNMNKRWQERRMFGSSVIFHRSSCVVIEYVPSLSRPSHDKIQVCTAYSESPKCPRCVSCVRVPFSKSLLCFNTTLSRDRRTRDAVQTHSSCMDVCAIRITLFPKYGVYNTSLSRFFSVHSYDVCFKKKNSPKQTWWLAWRSREIVCVPIKLLTRTNTPSLHNWRYYNALIFVRTPCHNLYVRHALFTLTCT